MLALRLSKIEKRLDALAKKTGRTKSFYAREAILRQIEDLEDYYIPPAAFPAARRAFRLKSSSRRSQSHDDVLCLLARRIRTSGRRARSAQA